MTSRKKRDPTFAASEKMALVDLVEQHFDIVESKKTDSGTINTKNSKWREIAEEFNAASSVHPREWTVLKNCWDNLKKKAKHQQTLRNQQHIQTGGGPFRPIIDDPVIERVLMLIQSRVSGFQNTFDSDNTHIICASKEENDTGTIIFDVNTDIQMEESGPSVNVTAEPATEIATTVTGPNWSQYTPSMLREVRNPILCRSPSPSNSPSILQHVQLDIHQPQQLAQDQSEQDPRTPLRVHTRVPTASAISTSRRRPILQGQKENLNLKRISMLTKANEHAEEEHNIKIKILKLQENQEDVKLKQELKKYEIQKEQDLRSKEEQVLRLKILKHQEQQECERTKQEVLKTKLLELQLREKGITLD